MTQAGQAFININNYQLPAFSKNFKILILISILFSLLSQTQSQSQSSISVNPVLKTINMNTTYQFTVADSIIKTISSNLAVIEISFPSSFFAFDTALSYTCVNTDTPSIVYSCRASTANVIQINNPLITTVVFKVSISLVKNPSSTEQVSFGYTFKYTNNGSIISQNSTDVFRNYSPGSLSVCTASFNPNTVHTTSQITITITLGNEVKKNGSIYVTFPSIWSDSANSSFPPIISSVSQLCTKKSSNNFLLSTISCSTVNQQVLISNSLNNTAPASSVLSFSISNILSPPTINTGYSIVVTTLTQTYAEIDKTTCIIDTVSTKSIAGVNPSAQLTVGSTTEFTFDFLAPTPIATGDKLIISAITPNDSFFSLSASSSVQVLYNALGLSIESSNSTSLTLVFPSMSVISASTKLSIIQGFFIKPLINSGTKSLVLTLKRGNSDYATQTFGLTILTNYLQSTNITLSTSVVSSSSIYTFLMTLSNSLGAKSRIVFTLPNSLYLTNGACTGIVSAQNNPSNINSSLACNVASNRIITLTSINTNLLQNGQKLTIAIQNILNSQTTQTTNPITIYTYYGDIYTDPTDVSLNQTVKMIAAIIGIASVSSSQPKVAQQGIYTISYTVKTNFLANSKIRIGLPSQITIGSSISTLFSLSYPNTTTTIDQSCSLLNYTINSVQYLQLSGISSIMLASSTVIIAKISFLVNPLSSKPSSSFSIIQFDSRGFEVQKLETGLVVTNTQTNIFPILYAVQSNVRMNGQVAIYTINIKASNDLSINDYFQIALDTATSKNNQIYFTNPIISCDISYTQNGVTTKIISTTERISSTLIKINLGQAFLSNRTYQIAINTITRPRTQQIPNTLTIRSFKYVSSNYLSIIGSLSYGISSTTISPKQNNKKNTMQSVSLNILTTPSQLFSFQSFATTITPKIPLLSGDYLVIKIPNIYTFTSSLVTVTSTTNLSPIASQSLCIESDYFCSHYSSDFYKIKVQQFSATFSSATSVTVTIKNNLYRSPSTFSYSGYTFKATSYASTNFIIDQPIVTGSTVTNLANAEFYVSCKTSLSDYHCMTCTTNGSCNACYQPTTINGTLYNFDGFKFLTSDFKCLSECGVGYFINTISNICTRCDSPCNTCETTSTTCLSCIQALTTNKYFSGNKTCLSSCPNGYYSDAGNICVQCASTCETCTLDAVTCTSCLSNTFLNSNTKACVISANCPFGTFADSTTNKCSTCNGSCSGCISLSTNCINCAAGYITDYTNSTFKNCTNLCPAGKVNDTVNNLGCRCQTQCKTCETTTSNCKSCDSSSIYKYFYGTTCLISCSQGTYASIIAATESDICLDCPQSNCKTCDALNCYQCIGQYGLYQGQCSQTCPTASVLSIQNGIRKCLSCTFGCLSCDLGTNKCSTCQSGYLKESNSTGTYCTTSCSASTVNFNNSICYTSCPDGYQNIGQICKLTQKNNTATQSSVSTGLSTTRKVPFPFVIASFVFLVIILLSKLVLPASIVSTLLTTIIGALEPFSWIVAVIVCILQTSDGIHWNSCTSGVYLIIAALIVNFVLNIIALIFFWRYVSKDQKFMYMFNYNQKKVVLGRCPTICVLILSVLASHKILQVLFSNFLSSRHFSYKLEALTNMIPLDYILFCSIIPSILAIAGGCKISYELQSYNVDSSTFIASLDMILITVIGIIASLWVTNRKNEDYEKQIDGNHHQKHYQTQQILVEGHGEDVTENINEVFMEQSGVRRLPNEGKNYFYQASKISQRGQNHDNDPLTKRNTTRKPINQSNKKKIRKSTLSHEQSSQALVINQKQKRRNLKDQFDSQENQSNKIDEEEDMQVIDLQNNNNDTLKDDQLKDMPLISKIRYPNKDRKQKPEQLMKMSTEQKKQLKQKIQSQLDPQQKQKLNILSKQKQLKIKKKKQKIEKILKISQSQKGQLDNQDQTKVDKIKQAVDLLKRKQIKIQEYLLYTEIIKQQEGQYDEESDKQISQINQKANTIINRFQDDDQQLQQVINLSPKRKIINSNKQQLSKSKSKQKQNTNQQDGRNNKSLQKDKKQTSKQKTIKKQSLTAKKQKNQKNQKKNKFKPPNDLQVNYDFDQGIANIDKNSGQYDSQQQPQISKNRSNIVNKVNKQKNRSQRYINLKKGLSQNDQDDIMMIDIGTNRHNRTQSQYGGPLQQQHTDSVPPQYLRSTQKLEYNKHKNNEQVNKNIYDSENQIQTQKSFDNAEMDFYNQISPSQFGIQNKKIDYIQSQDMPVKPKIIVQNLDQNNTTMQKNRRSPTKNDGFDIYQDEQMDNQNYQSKLDLNNTMNRSSSQIHDYNSIIIRKTLQNQKLKQLQKIYMPKVDSKMLKKPKRDNSMSKISQSKN